MRWAAFLLAVALGLGGSLAIAGFGFGQISFTVRIGTESAEVGGQTTVNLDIVNIEGEPGVGAWRIDVAYNPDIVSIAACAPNDNGSCNQEYADNTLQVIGATATGQLEDFRIATITFECQAVGASPLALTYASADATIATTGTEQDVTIEHGAVFCRDPEAELATPTAGPVVLPDTGTGGTAESGVALWLFPTLVGLAAVALLTAWRLLLPARHS